MHVLKTKNIKHYAVAAPLGISRQAFSKRLKNGSFTEEELVIVARALDMDRESLENVDPKQTEEALKTFAKRNNVVLSYNLTFNFKGVTDDAIEKIAGMVKQLEKFSEQGNE